GNRHAAVGLESPDCQLQAGRGTNAEIDYFTTGGQQSGHYCRSDHWARWSRIPADENTSAIEISTKRLRKGNGDLRSKRLTDDTADSGDADFERFHHCRVTSSATILYLIPAELNSSPDFQPLIYSKTVGSRQKNEDC